MCLKFRKNVAKMNEKMKDVNREKETLKKEPNLSFELKTMIFEMKNIQWD